VCRRLAVPLSRRPPRDTNYVAEYVWYIQYTIVGEPTNSYLGTTSYSDQRKAASAQLRRTFLSRRLKRGPVRPGRLSDTKVLQYWITVQDILPEYPGWSVRPRPGDGRAVVLSAAPAALPKG
jgi:hypothetical protein